jgi:hypothetical protein
MIMMHVINVYFNKTPFLLYNNNFNCRRMNGNWKNKLILMNWKVYWWTQRMIKISNSITYLWTKIWWRSWSKKAPWGYLKRSRGMVSSYLILTSRFLLMRLRDSFKINMLVIISPISLSVIHPKFQFSNW